MKSEQKPGERIAKVMARAGIASRRESERMIAEGRVKLNGTKLTTPAITVTSKDTIVVDGKPLSSADKTRLWRFHKPKGCLTTERDPKGRPTIFDKLPKEMPRVMTVGRLDYNSEGLLLLTNDGGLARTLELPKTAWTRKYRVRVHGNPDQKMLDRLSKGVTVQGVHYGPITANLEQNKAANAWINVTLREGKNREIRRVMEHLGMTVNRLIRVSFGPFQLGDLAASSVKEVTGRVLKDQLGDLHDTNK